MPKRDWGHVDVWIEPWDFVPVSAEVIEGAPRPGHGQAQALFGARAIGRILGALVEGHANIRAESDLHIDRVLGREKVRTSVEVGAEAHAVVAHFAQLVEREDLKAPRIGEQGARPTDEFVQAAHAADGLVAGAQIKVIGVAENDLSAERFERFLRDGFDRSLRADRHEDGGFDGPMRQNQTRAASAAGARLQHFEGDVHGTILRDYGAPGLWEGMRRSQRFSRSPAKISLDNYT